MIQTQGKRAAAAVLDDAELVRRVLARDADAFRTIMQRHNRRLYRIARSVLRNNAEAEDVVQEAYVSDLHTSFKLSGRVEPRRLALPHHHE